VIGRVASAFLAAAAALSGISGSPAPDERPPFLVAFDAETGKTRWRVSAGERAGYLSVHDTRGDLVYGVRIRCGIDLKPSLIAFDVDNGAESWQARVSHDMDVSVGKGAVVVVDRGEKLRGLDPNSGSVRWKQDLEGFEPTSGNHELVLASGSDGERRVVRAIDRRTGRIRWEYPFSGTPGDPVADDDTVVLAVGPERDTAPTNPVFAIHVLDARTGTPKSQFGVPYLPDGVDVTGSIVTVATGSIVNGYDAATGDQIWTASGRFDSALGGPSDALVLRRASGDTTSPAYSVLDPTTGVTVNAIAGSSEGGFDVHDDLFAVTEVQARGEGLRTNVRVIELDSGSVRWTRRIDSYVEVAIGRDAVYAAGGCETAP
jgi:outer membrane protein assembly factor BamB